MLLVLEANSGITKPEACLKVINIWMMSSFLLLNSDKTEVIVLCPKHCRNALSNDIATLKGITLIFSTTVKTFCCYL